VIDDSCLGRKLIKRLINQVKMDAGVAEADGVDSALGMITIEHFDCILIDYHLSGIDGVSLANQIRASHDQATPMVRLTAEPSPALAKQALC
ncbi:MAG: response regulator, partial [Geminicoccaceae bacterium]